MEYKKIDACKDNYILFYKEHMDETKCLKCGKSRFVEVVNEDFEKVTTKVIHKQLRYMPLIPRMKRLFLSKKTAKHMRWHKEVVRENDQVMVHPSDSEAWKALDDFDADFTRDAWNVCIGLAMDGFSLYNTSAASYSSWPVFAILYNISPSLCMKYGYMFLCLIIFSLDHPKTHINVMLKPLIDELKQLWEGVQPYDYNQKQKFNLRVVYLCSVYDFRAYNIFSGWSYNGILTCPICMNDTSCFRLKFGGEISYFNCHRCFLPLDHPFRLDSNTFKKDNIILEGLPRRLSSSEIAHMLDNLVLKKNGDEFIGYGKGHNWTHKYTLWELTYVKVLILMHNIDVMHQEYNVGESILSTCMAFADKIKHNHKARNDLAQLCNRSSLELKSRGGKPRASFCLKPKERKEVLIWLQKNLESGKLSGVKSHDYHIFMERLIPVIFCGT
jgi:hypothetical protein